jgi:4-alpha-glucanotransferase
VPRDFFRGRHAGLLVPLFSLASREGWGIGEIGDLPKLDAWMSDAGFSFVQLLPLNEMAVGQNSPYSALTAMAIDPVFISPSAVPEVQEVGGESLLTHAERAELERVRAASAIDYATTRRLKDRALRAGFDHFLREHWNKNTTRGRRLRLYSGRERWWLDEYALFRALHAKYGGRDWHHWDAPVRDRVPSAILAARRELDIEILYYTYLQWLAADQWESARNEMNAGVFGDFPFMVSGDSADVWARQRDFRFDASVGAPPDAFSETGQDWGFPAYRWREIAAGGFRWLAQRARRNAALYDGYRVDHLVGFFRTYVREQNGDAAFVPADERDQIAQGVRVLEVLSATGARVTAEDLGVIPQFVRDALADLDIPGYKVLRWEREWEKDGKPFRNPREYPSCSVATSGTHDTEPLAEWWDAAPADERQALATIVCVDPPGCDPASTFDERTRDAILQALFASSSDLLILPIHDVFGWRERINTPALISERNWTWKLPWPVEELSAEPAARERAAFARAQSERFDRGQG